MPDYCENCSKLIAPEYTSNKPHANLELLSQEHVAGRHPLNFLYYKCKVCDNTLLCIDDMLETAQWM